MVQYDKKRFLINLWDTAGEEKYHALAPNYYRDANGALLIFDLTKKESFELVEKWILEIRSVVSDNFQIVICANKCDIFSKIEIKEEQIQEICLKYNTEYVLTSAKSGKNVYDSFMLLTGKIGDDLLHSNKSQKQRRKTVTIDKNNMSMTKSFIKDKGKKDGGCC